MWRVRFVVCAQSLKAVCAVCAVCVFACCVCDRGEPVSARALAEQPEELA
jgi:hypothetical protein